MGGEFCNEIFCIKTNNNAILEYLLDKLDYLELEEVKYSKINLNILQYNCTLYWRKNIFFLMKN